MPKTNVRWSSQLAFIFATSGAAIGLGNIWRFPYVAGQNGGGAFVLVYLVCVLGIGLPLMMAEILLGRHGRQNPEESIGLWAEQAKVGRGWKWVGSLTVLSAFIILTFYIVISGWVLHYFFLSVTGHFHQLDVADTHRIWQSLHNNFAMQALWTSLVVAATIIIIAAGVHQGIEKVVYVMFPILIILLVILLGYAWQSSSFTQGLAFLFQPDFYRLNMHTILEAVGQSFFSLGIAVGVLMMYGAYLPETNSVSQTSLAVSLADTGIALLAGMAIFPVLFSQNLTPGQGSSLIFKTLPLAFSHMPFGGLFAALFFLMLEIAAFASAIGFLEPAAIWLKERLSIPRPLAAWIMGIIVWLIGLLHIASMSIWPDTKLLDMNLFQWAQQITAKVTLPLGGLLVALFCGWRLPAQVLRAQLHTRFNWLFWGWLWTLRAVAPIGIILVLVGAFLY